MKDLYEILELDKNVEHSEIKKKYRKLAIKHHPDKGGDENKFKEIAEAYQILNDTEKRKTYDQFGYDAVKNSDVNSSPFDIFNNIFGGEDVSNIFSNFPDIKGVGPFQNIFSQNNNTEKLDDFCEIIANAINNA